MISNWCQAGIHEACSRSMRATNGKTFRCMCQHHDVDEAEARAAEERKEARRAGYRRTSTYDDD